MIDTVIGLLGFPVRHSISPAMMNAALRHVKLDGVYVPFNVSSDHLDDAVRGLIALGMRGVNVTIPHKEAVMRFADELTDEARLVGAVNTLRFDISPNRVIGHNTDVLGWWSSVAHVVRPEMQRVALLGAGGAARAVIAAVALHAPQVRLDIVARNRLKADVLVRDFGKLVHVQQVAWERRHEAITDSDLVVNTTPVGMWPNVDASPIDDDECFHAGQVVQDIVYRPLETAMMSQARARGSTVIDGLQMLIYQGAKSFEFWTGLEAPIEIMTEAARHALDS